MNATIVVSTPSVSSNVRRSPKNQHRPSTTTMGLVARVGDPKREREDALIEVSEDPRRRHNRNLECQLQMLESRMSRWGN